MNNIEKIVSLVTLDTARWFETFNDLQDNVVRKTDQLCKGQLSREERVEIAWLCDELRQICKRGSFDPEDEIMIWRRVYGNVYLINQILCPAMMRMRMGMKVCDSMIQATINSAYSCVQKAVQIKQVQFCNDAAHKCTN